MPLVLYYLVEPNPFLVLYVLRMPFNIIHLKVSLSYVVLDTFFVEKTHCFHVFKVALTTIV